VRPATVKNGWQFSVPNDIRWQPVSVSYDSFCALTP
jgi:hypothetical protein